MPPPPLLLLFTTAITDDVTGGCWEARSLLVIVLAPVDDPVESRRSRLRCLRCLRSSTSFRADPG